MKRTMLKSFIIFGFLFLSRQVFACEMSFEPAEVKGKVGDEVTVTAIFVLEHRVCTCPTKDATIEYENVEKVKESGWIELEKGTFTNQLTIKLIKEGKGKIRAWRECSKKGVSDAVLQITISK